MAHFWKIAHVTYSNSSIIRLFRQYLIASVNEAMNESSSSSSRPLSFRFIVDP